uniref:LRRCT domain-containing protein n=1 Tax=Fundulus heteroclitus TaxID=8078 RepID=A0A3Q2PLE8_FUNHE
MRRHRRRTCVFLGVLLLFAPCRCLECPLLNLSRSLHNFTALTDLATALRWGGLWGLLRLDLSGNLLALLPPGMFSHVPALQRLLLGNNSLAAVYAGTFSGIERLQMLDLTRNDFEAFTGDALQELERLGNARIFLGSNPYACSCESRDFVTWLNKTKSRVDADAVRCASPEELADARVQGLTVRAIGCVVPVLAEVTDLTLQTRSSAPGTRFLLSLSLSLSFFKPEETARMCRVVASRSVAAVPDPGLRVCRASRLLPDATKTHLEVPGSVDAPSPLKALAAGAASA